MHSPYLFNSIYMLFIHCILLYFLINNKKRGFLFQQNYLKIQAVDSPASYEYRTHTTPYGTRKKYRFFPVLQKQRKREREKELVFHLPSSCHPLQQLCQVQSHCQCIPRNHLLCAAAGCNFNYAARIITRNIYIRGINIIMYTDR